LKILRPAESGTKEAAPVPGDYSFVDPKTTSKLRSSVEELATRFASPVRRAIRKAERSDVSAVDYFRVDPSDRQCSIPAYHDSGFHKRIFGRLPLAFNRLAGSMIYPHLD
jgi:hypothetical protein